MIYMKDYKTIKNLNQAKKSKQEISRRTGFDPKTIRKYLKMSGEEFVKYSDKLKNRMKVFEPYKTDIIEIFKKNNNKQVYKSSIYDYLREKYSELPGSERTLRNYITYLKKAGEIAQVPERKYEPVEETPPGKQMQLDFGEEKIAGGGKEYIFATLLSHSRARYVNTQEHLFTTLEVIAHLLDSFTYFGGIPEEIVIDQDRTIVVNENHGDVLLTKEFETFRQEQGFEFYVCRKADPETKGKVENLVKFVKSSFFSARTFESHSQVAESLNLWLERTANGRICQSTGRIPAVAMQEEKPYLMPLKDSIFCKDDILNFERRIADKCSLVSIGSNKYSVPVEYSGKEMLILRREDTISIYDIKTKEEIATHKRANIRGKTVKNTNHYRNKENNIRQSLEHLRKLYDVPDWESFVEMNYKTYQRYFRDQIKLSERYLPHIKDSGYLNSALKLCIEMKSYSFKHLHESYIYYEQLGENKITDIIPEVKAGINNIRQKDMRENVEKRNVAYYNSLLSVLGFIGAVL